MSSVIIRHLRVPLFFASSSSMNFGLSQVGIHNVPYRTGDYSHMMKSQRKLVKASQTHSQPLLRSDFSLRIYGVIYHGGDCRNAGNSGQCHLMYWLSSSMHFPQCSLSAQSTGSSSSRYNPKAGGKTEDCCS